MSTQHTPTPWRVERKQIGPAIFDADGNDVVRFDDQYSDHFRSENRENAAFIVRAVNSHAELVAAAEAAEKSLQWVLSVMQDIPSGSNLVETYHDLQGAIAKAKGQP